MCPAKTQLSQDIIFSRSEILLCTYRVAETSDFFMWLGETLVRLGKCSSFTGHIGTSVGFDHALGKTCLKRPLKKKTKIGFQDRILLNAGQNYFRLSLSYHLSLRSLFCLFLSGHLRLFDLILYVPSTIFLL